MVEIRIDKGLGNAKIIIVCNKEIEIYNGYMEEAIKITKKIINNSNITYDKDYIEDWKELIKEVKQK